MTGVSSLGLSLIFRDYLPLCIFLSILIKYIVSYPLNQKIYNQTKERKYMMEHEKVVCSEFVIQWMSTIKMEML